VGGARLSSELECEMEKSMTNYEDEFDLKLIIKTLLGYKWWILGFTILVSTVAWISNAYFFPKEYQSLASITISPMNLNRDFDPEAPILLGAPEITTLALKAQGSNIVGQLDLSLKDENIINTMVITRENGQIDLSATGSSPDEVAHYADLWAEEFVAFLVMEYGFEGAYSKQVNRVGSENLIWSYPQDALTGSLNGLANVLEVRLGQAKETLEHNLAIIDNHKGLIDDIQVLDALLALEGQNAKFSTGMPLAIMAFQRAADENSGSPEYFPEEYTIAQGRADLRILLDTLQERSAEIESQISKDEERIINLADELGFVLSLQNARIIVNANPAVIPTSPASPRTIMNTALAGAVALMVSVGIVFVIEWWREPVEGDQ
jgi:capsular polysaccharide biosynthesis protein